MFEVYRNSYTLLSLYSMSDDTSDGGGNDAYPSASDGGSINAHPSPSHGGSIHAHPSASDGGSINAHPSTSRGGSIHAHPSTSDGHSIQAYPSADCGGSIDADLLYASLIPDSFLYSSDSEDEKVLLPVEDSQVLQTKQACHYKKYENN